MLHSMKTKLPYLLALCLMLSGCAPSAGISAGEQPLTAETASAGSQSPSDSPAYGTQGLDVPSSGSQASAQPSDGGGQTSVHFIDVGQGDSILIESGGEAMLIDAGTNESGPTVLSYLEDQQITHLDWVIGTHPHEDHIGGLDDVILALDVDRVMLPPKEHTTKTFEDVLDAVAQKDLSLTEPVAGDTYALGDARFTILGPVKDYGDDLNNWSVVLLLTCDNNRFLFTGDAEAQAEEDILALGMDIHANVLKVGHHGSDTSTSDSFLSAVSPDYAVISVGSGNDYGHPCQVTLDKLEAFGTQIFRTDLMGTVIARSDGTHLSFSTEDHRQSQTETEAQTQVHITQSGSKYHREGCGALKNSDIIISLEEAKNRGYTPCQKCNPPK